MRHVIQVLIVGTILGVAVMAGVLLYVDNVTNQLAQEMAK